MKTTKGGRMDTRKKQLINLPEEDKAWITKVVELAIAAGQDCNQTEIIRALVGQARRDDPEIFVGKLAKLKLKAKIDDIERRAAALEREKAEAVEQLNAGQGQKQMAHNAR